MIKATVKTTEVFELLRLIQTPAYKLKITGEIRTDPALIDIILDHLPNKLWKNGGRFLDPCCGRGTFILKIIDRLLLYHSKEKILKMIYAIDIDAHCIRTTRELVAKKLGVGSQCLISTIYQDNFLKSAHAMTCKDTGKALDFDLVAGNPPFQEGKRGDQANKLWPQFVRKSYELLVPNGYLGMITPTGWMQPTADIGKGTGKNSFSIFNDIMKKNNLIYANIDSDRIRESYFKGVGSTFSHYLISKTTYSGKTKFVTDNGHVNIDITSIESLPKITSKESLSISAKMIGEPFLFNDQNHGLNGVEGKTPGITTIGKKIKNSIVNSQHNLQYPIYHTNKNNGTYWFGEKLNPHASKAKVIISLSGKYLPVFNNTNGFSNMCLALICTNNRQAERAQAILSSKLYRFWVEMQKFSGFNPRKLILNLPALPLTRNWSDADIYQHFKLTQDEIHYVQSIIK